MRILARATVTVRRVLDAVLIALILVVVSGVVLAKIVPLTGRDTIIVGGRSMEPALAMGSAVVVAPVAASELRVGDVVSLHAGKEASLFTHRVTAILDSPDGISIRTKGDANASEDPTPVPAADIVGRVDLTIPLAGYLIALLSIPTGVLFMIGLAATLLAAVWLLESLELDHVAHLRIDMPSGQGAEIGEPLSPRPGRGSVGIATVAAETGYGRGRLGVGRLAVADQIALARAARARRNRWDGGHAGGDHAAD
ncbi:MAG: signal peptidase I [Chloroflexota bacterium]